MNRLTVVTGPPCSGKSTFVQDERLVGDLVLDLDLIAQSMGYPHRQIEWDSPHPAVAAARSARSHVIFALVAGKLVGPAWIIDSRPTVTMLGHYLRAGARMVDLDPGHAVCRERAAGRPAATLDQIDAWYRTDSRRGSLDIFG